MKTLVQQFKLLIGFLVVGCGLTIGGAATILVRAQSPLDGFDPNANGIVRAIVVQSNGKIIIGGDFTTVAPNGGAAVIRNRIARFNSDGTLDSAFNPNANNIVHTTVLQTDGKILVGGNFGGANSIGGATRNNIARLNADGSLDTAFNPNANGTVFSIAVQADGKILVGGGFISIGGATRNRIARLDATTGTADSFDPNANNSVRAIALQADGKILVGGDFNVGSNIGGAARNRIARLDATSGLADSFNPNANGTVFSIAVQADGKILVGGGFTTVAPNGGAAVTRNRIARLDATSGLADSFDPNAGGEVLSIAVQADGKILIGGVFITLAPNNGVVETRNRIARLETNGLLDTAFNPNASANIRAIASQADGKILVGGDFSGATSIGGATRNRFARLERDGTLDRTLDINAVGDFVFTSAVQPDGKIIVGGNFTSILGAPRNNIARLNADGSLDTAFNPNANNFVYSIALQASGKILVGGEFTSIGGATRNFIASLEATTGAADSFDPNANANVRAIAVQTDGRILIGGGFNTLTPNGGGTTVPRSRIARLEPSGLVDAGFDPNVSGVGTSVRSIAVQANGKILIGGDFTALEPNGGFALRNRIARLEPSGLIDEDFDPNADGDVYPIAVQADGKILIGGFFTNIGGTARNFIARVDAISGAADSFNPNANSDVYSVAVQANNQILISGFFTNVGGTARNYIARLEPSGLVDTSFNPNANNFVRSITTGADGKIPIGGDFTTVNGQTRNCFARLSNNTAALQNLSATRSNITWARGGASSELQRVTFEVSTNGTNFTALGAGSRVGTSADWTLSGAAVPENQNIFIRARGYTRGGTFTGSGGLVESVRNAYFLVVPTAAAVSVGGRVTSNSNGAKARGVARALVTLTGAEGNTRTTITNSFGYYRFAEVGAGATYVFAVTHKRYTFATQAIYVGEEADNIDFTALF